MTIQKIAQMQRDTTSTIHFARKGTSDCYWFDNGMLNIYRDAPGAGRRVSLDLEGLAATDWQIIKH
jgi:hypothetical protein